MCAAALAFCAQAEVTTFITNGAPRVYCPYLEQGEVIEIPTGFTPITASDVHNRAANNQRKAMTGTLVQLNEQYLYNADNWNSSCNYSLGGSFRLYKNRGYQVIPAKGVTVKKIEIRAQDNRYNKQFSIVEPVEGSSNATGWLQDAYTKVEDFKVDSDVLQSWEGSRTEPFVFFQTVDNGGRFFYITVTTEGTPEQCALPVVSENEDFIATGKTIELSCPTEGAQIYYTVDYEGVYPSLNHPEALLFPENLADATLYTGPITLEKDAIVRAIAVKDGLANSFPIYKEYYLINEFDGVALFDFNDYTSLKDENGEVVPVYNTYPIVDTEISTGTTQNCRIKLEDEADEPGKDGFRPRPLYNNGVFFYNDPNASANCNVCLSNSFGGVTELRPLAGSTMVFDAPVDCHIVAVYLQSCVNTAAKGDAFALNSETEGVLETSQWFKARQIWRTDSKEVTQVKINGAKNCYVDKVHVVFVSDNAGVSGIAVDNNAPVEYFNLQGIRVANPTNGIFIKRQGSKATKVIL